MRLIRCYVESFGALSGFECRFDPALTCINSPNGSGKSTLAAFIKAMLYGMPDTRRQAVTDNDRRRYLPWQGGRYGGSLTFSHGGRDYTVERSFGQRPSEDTCVIRYADTGAVCRELTEPLGEGLLGIDGRAFERTLMLSERRLRPSSAPEAICARLSELMGSDGDVGAYGSAMDMLENSRRRYSKRGGGGDISELRSRMDSVERRIRELQTVRSSAENKIERIRRMRAELDTLKKRRQKIDGDLRTASGQYARRESKPNSEELRRFFTRPTDSEELGRMERKCQRLSELADRLDCIKYGKDEFTAEQGKLFPLGLPRALSTDKLRRYIKGKRNLLTAGAVMGALAILSVFVAPYLSPIIYGLSAILAVLSLSLILLGANKASAVTLAKESGLPGNSKRDAAKELSQRLSQFKHLEADRELERERAELERDSIARELDAFIAGYPELPRLSRCDSIHLIRRRYEEYFQYSPITAEAEPRTVDQEAIARNLADIDGQIGLLIRELALAESEYERYSEELDTEEELRAEKTELAASLDECNRRLSLIQKTEALMTQARDNLQGKYSTGMRQRFTHYAGLLGQVGEFRLDAELNLTKEERGALREEDCFSRGTVDLYDFCLRVSLIDCLFTEELPFLILDDPFTAMDDGRVRRAIELIRSMSRDRQIIYFTCSESRAF